MGNKNVDYSSEARDRLVEWAKEELKNEYDEKKLLRSKKRVLWIIGVIGLLFVCCMMTFNLIVLPKQISDPVTADAVYKSALLSDGLSIIGFTISVWAGLNIINALERRKVDEIEKKLNELEKEKLDKLKNSIQCMNDDISNSKEQLSDVNARLNEANENIVTFTEARKGIENFYLSTFENELLKTSHKLPSMWLYEQFINDIEMESNLIRSYVIHLIPIEQIYAKIVQLYENRKNLEEEYRQATEIGIKMIAKQQIEYIETSSYVYRYLTFRKAEIEYYASYSYPEYAELKKHSDIAVENYNRFTQSVFEIDLLNDANYRDVLNSLRNKAQKEKAMAASLASACGDAVSITVLKRLQSNNPIQGEEKNLLLGDIDKAIKCEELAVSICGLIPEEKEIYYRDLGCAYERKDRIYNTLDHAKQIIECYSKAYDLAVSGQDDRRIRFSYRTYAMYLRTYLERKIELQKWYDSDSREPILRWSPSEEEKKYLPCLLHITALAMKEFPREKVYHTLNGFAHTIQFALYKDSETRTEDLKAIDELLKQLSFRGVCAQNDPFFKLLSERYDKMITIVQGRTGGN